jgi:hypothetical protein
MNGQARKIPDRADIFAGRVTESAEGKRRTAIARKM